MNWAQLIVDLQAKGQTQADIARHCSCSQPTISDIARGEIKEPRHSLGEALLALHARLKGARASRAA